MSGRIHKLYKKLEVERPSGDELKRVLEELVFLERRLPELIDTDGIELKDKSIVMIGKFNKPKILLKKKILKAGGKILDKITERTDYIIIGDNINKNLESIHKSRARILTQESILKFFGL
jgi:NAD-dependent DNA ligase